MSETRSAPSNFDLFVGFFFIGVFGFGGVLPSARRMIVERRKWLTQAEFTDMLGLCQFLPGGNIMNVTVALGSRFRGPLGAMFAFVGLMAAPVAIVIGLGVIYDRFASRPAVHGAFTALSAAAAGYLLSTAWKIASPLKRRPFAIAIAAATLLAIAVLRLPLLLALPALAIISTILAAWREQ
jgi:chromate transporter